MKICYIIAKIRNVFQSRTIVLIIFGFDGDLIIFEHPKGLSQPSFDDDIDQKLRTL